MKRYKISKNKIRHAIITEHLQSGNFFNNNILKDDGICSVCAIGAILRKVKKSEFNYVDGYTLTDYNSSSLDRKSTPYDNFLSELSVEFEHYSEQELSASNDMRMFLLFLIEAECPKTLTFEV